MKKCPKCEKIYDNSWGLCLHCGSSLLYLQDRTKEKDDRSDLPQDSNPLVFILLIIIGLALWHVLLPIIIGALIIIGIVLIIRHMNNIAPSTVTSEAALLPESYESRV